MRVTMGAVTFAATQMSCGDDRDANVARAEEQVRAAASKDAQVILLQELFETPYFCKDLDSKYFDFAQDANSSELLQKFSTLAKELDVVLPISFFYFLRTSGIIEAKNGERIPVIFQRVFLPNPIMLLIGNFKGFGKQVDEFLGFLCQRIPRQGYLVSQG